MVGIDILEKVIVPQVVNKCLRFIKLENSLPCSKQPITGSYTEPDLSAPHPPILILQDHFHDYSLICAQLFLAVHFLQVFEPNSAGISFLSQAWPMSRQRHFSCFDHISNCLTNCLYN
jgi:hypothetical protein